MTNDLTAEQQELFELRLKELGMNLSQVVDELVTGDTPGPTVLSELADVESALPAHVFTIDSVDEVKRLGGNANEDFESGYMQEHHYIPEEWPQEKNDYLPEDLEAHENNDIQKALIAYVYGHSDRVISYKNIIEKHYFPMVIGAFAIKNVVVSPGHPLILQGNNQTYNFGTVTIKSGGQIQNKATNVTLVAQKMIAE